MHGQASDCDIAVHILIIQKMNNGSVEVPSYDANKIARLPGDSAASKYILQLPLVWLRQCLIQSYSTIMKYQTGYTVTPVGVVLLKVKKK